MDDFVSEIILSTDASIHKKMFERSTLLVNKNQNFRKDYATTNIRQQIMQQILEAF